MLEVVIPETLWEEDRSGSISIWLYTDGATVKKGDVLAEVLVEKTTLELLSPGDGVLQIRVQPEIEVRRGEVVAVLV
jgi:2-oxoglutarate dehydrogenase E2 component (dihydrolipoamide succinyltransferase)